jgi:hypothetical protein
MVLSFLLIQTIDTLQRTRGVQSMSANADISQTQQMSSESPKLSTIKTQF